MTQLYNMHAPVSQGEIHFVFGSHNHTCHQNLGFINLGILIIREEMFWFCIIIRNSEQLDWEKKMHLNDISFHEVRLVEAWI